MGTIYPGAPGATGWQARVRSLAEHATSNTTEEANGRCRTPDDSAAEDEHSDHNRTTPAIRQAPAWAPFTFRGLSCELSHTAYGRFGGPDQLDPSPLPPCAPSAIRRFNRRADEKAHGVVRCPRAVPHGKIGGTMAHTAECVAPEGNQDRDEWMTVIEMQEYIRARREDLRHALVDGVTASQNQVRTDKGKLPVAFASQLRRSILVFRNLEEAANLFQGHHQQQFHPVPLLHSPPAHAIRLSVAH